MYECMMLVQVGGPSWRLSFGRKDVRIANKTLAEEILPSPFANVHELIENFRKVGLNSRDMTSLSGGHTIGISRCIAFRQRIYSNESIDPSFAATRQETCPSEFGDGNENPAPLDLKTPGVFDNQYYKNLVVQRGLLISDQVLFDGGSQDSLVLKYSTNQAAFFNDFASGMAKMAKIPIARGTPVEIRTNCRKVN